MGPALSNGCRNSQGPIEQSPAGLMAEHTERELSRWPCWGEWAPIDGPSSNSGCNASEEVALHKQGRAVAVELGSHARLGSGKG